jgi:NHLM bacteriocin system ABC transporter ATP-binding protein
MNDILAWFKAEKGTLPDNAGNMDIEEQIDCILRPSGIQKRIVQLPGSWYRDCAGPLLGEMNEKLVALIPGIFGTYHYKEPQSGRVIKVNKRNAALISGFAYCFYPVLPKRKLRPCDIFSFLFRTVPKSNFISYIISVLAVTCLGLIVPALYHIFFAQVIPGRRPELLAAGLALLLGMSLSIFLIGICRDLFLARSSTLMKLNLQAAFMDRLLAMPTAFFRKYTDGELAERISSSAYLCDALTGSVMPDCLAALFSILYCTQIALYAPALLLPVFIFSALILLVFGLALRAFAKLLAERFEKRGRLSGLVFELFSGIGKIKLFGAEKRAFRQWENQYAPLARLSFRPPFIIKCYRPLSALVSTAGIIVNFYIASRCRMSVPGFIAFNMAFGMFSASLFSLTANPESFASLASLIKFLAPLMEEKCENRTGKKVVATISGRIDMENISFRYTDEGPLILDNFSLHIDPGQYIGVAGETGCGKSTLFRLLLGFERPKSGSILYDGNDLKGLDLNSLRRNLGVVLQSGTLMPGTILENICLNLPSPDTDAAWQAAEIAGIADDIKAMPMGMYTFAAEGGTGFSGGQQQRILIARALASRPRVLLLDEATSALDNITQSRIEKALAALHITRIVIAHRLSTLQSCERIIVLDKGRIAEDGTYGELLRKGGAFASLVEKQQLFPHPF